MRDTEQRETLLRWIAGHIVDEVVSSEWVCDMTLSIKKVTLNFAAKFWWSIIRAKLSPTMVDSIMTWDRVVMLAYLMAGHEIDFSQSLIAEIHERAFQEETTLPFTCLKIFLCRKATVPVWGCDRLIEMTKMVDVGIIRDDAKPAAPWRDIHFNLPHMNEDLASTQPEEGNISAPPMHPDMAAPPSSSSGPAESIPRAPTPTSYALMLLTRVQKLETQMATLLQHIHPWMKKAVEKSEKRVEQVVVVKIQDDGGDVVLNELFSKDEPALIRHRVAGKCTGASERTTDTEEEQRARKENMHQFEVVQKQLRLNEEMRKLIERELAARASGSRGTTDDATSVIV
uniref:Putative plant transposon protein domain-containing protein n=1 Tax=Solanum tuberosum TaxID=4113 RepID=M1DGV9_SOLTU